MGKEHGKGYTICTSITSGVSERGGEDRRRQKTTNRGNENSLVGSCLLSSPVLSLSVDGFIRKEIKKG